MDFFEHFDDNSIFHRIFLSGEENNVKISFLNNFAQNEILQKFNEIDEIITSKNSNADILCFSYIIQVLGILDSQLNNKIDRTATTKIPQKLKDAVNYIHENFTEQITISDISNHCSISSTYLARMFKKVYISTPLEYITKLRISYAKNLLTNGLSISEVCYRSGFNDYNHFIKKFKCVVGVTPSKYKKKLKS